MGISAWIGYGPWFIAQQEGYFKRLGLHVTFVNINDSTAYTTALASGKMDGASIATNNLFRVAASGTPLKVVLLEDLSVKADAILGGPGINSVAQLKGKSVAYEQGSTSDILLRYALAQNHLSVNDVKQVPMQASAAGTAALAGRVQSAVTYEPYVTATLDQHKGFHIIYAAGEDPGLISDTFVVTGDTLAKRPGDVVALLRAWNMAVTFYRTHTAEAQAIIARAVGATPASLKTAFEGVQLYSLPQALSQLRGHFGHVTFGDVYRTSESAGEAPTGVSIGSYIYPAPAQAALR